MSKRNTLLIFTFGILLAFFGIANLFGDPLDNVLGSFVGTVCEEGYECVRVEKVVDGDTIVLKGGYRVRYIGIDTPESVKPNSPVECFAKEASKINGKLVRGKVVRMEKDVSETDRYGRLLRYVWVGDVFVNEYLVREGYANVSTFPPDVKYKDLFVEAEREAREGSKGLWQECEAPA